MKYVNTTRTKVCLHCQKVFFPKFGNFARTKFCSRSCGHIGKVSYSWAHRKIKVSGRLGKKNSQKQKDMMRAKVGVLHPRWVEDRTKVISRFKDILSAPRYIEWRKSVFTRDQWKCKIGNSDCKGQLESHHILPWRDYQELRYEINNGITLCHFHHPRKRAEEKRLAPIFQKLTSPYHILL